MYAAPTLTPFAARLAEHGDRPAVMADGATLTYRELADAVDEVAARLGDGRRLVLLRARNDLGSLLGYLAALRAGHPLLMADAGNPQQVDELLGAYDPDVVLDGCDVHRRRPGSAHTLHPDLALLLSTSGSTGSPKLVRLSHRNLGANAEAIAAYLGLAGDDRAVTSLPLHYCYGLSVVNSHLARGAGIVVTDRSVVDACFWNAVSAHRVTHLAGVPYTFDLLDRIGFGDMQLPSLRHVTQAGGRLAPDRVRRYVELGRRRGWRFFVMYGQTEATARMAYLPPEMAARHPDCIGVPIPGGSFEIVTVDGCDQGEGELVYRGPNVMLGYAEGPSDLGAGAAVDALRTGDIAARTPEGLYRIVGRRGRFVKLFGLRIDLDHLERALANVGIDAACAGDDERIVVAAETAGDVRLVQETIHDRVGLPPAAVLPILGPVPRLANGKPDYAAIRRAASQPACPAPELGRPRPSQTVAGAFAAVMGCDRVDDDDTFVTLGGDSLSYVEMSLALEEVLGHLPPQWHTTPIGVLSSAPRRHRAVCRVEANVVVRAVAIVLVVANHADLLSVAGGAHALLAVAGFNFARFQLASGRMLRSAARIAVPSMCWIGVMAATRDDFGLAHALLVNGWVGGEGERWSYWFVEVLVQLLLVLAAAFSVDRVRRFERRRTWDVAAMVLAVALVVRFDLVGLPAMSHPTARPHQVLWLFAVGWAAALAGSTLRRALLSLCAAVAVYGFFGDIAREAVVLAGVLVLVWVPSVPVLRPLHRVVGTVAAASLYVYLTHWAVFPPLRDRFSPLVATLGSLAVGVAAAWVARRLSHPSFRLRIRPACGPNPQPERARAA